MSAASVMAALPVPFRGANDSGSGYNLTMLGTIPGTAHTWSAWIELLASSSIDADGLFIYDSFNPQLNVIGWLDIGVGAAGSEVTVARYSKVLVIQTPSSRTQWYFVPIAIRRGSRIALRFRQGSTTAGGDDGTGRVGIMLLPRGGRYPIGCAQFAHLGATFTDGSTSAGTTIDPGTTFNTFGAWTSLGTSPLDARWAVLNLDRGADGAFQNCELEIGVGAAGAQATQAAIYTRVWNLRYLEPSPPPLPVRIPAGATVWVRARASTTGTGRFVNASLGLYG